MNWLLCYVAKTFRYTFVIILSAGSFLPRRLYVKKSSRHITAYVEHINGNVVVSASTKEWAVKQHLYSTSDVSASLNLGRVLAQRCLESGVSYVHVNMFQSKKEQEGVCNFSRPF